MTGWLWLLMVAGGAALLGAGIAYNLIVTRRRRNDPAAQRRTERATEALYRKEEKAREREETS
jgi:hypothetical protein